VRWAALAALAALALTGCETSAEKSAKLERAALARLPTGAAPSGLKITRASAVLKILSSVVLHDSEGTAAVVTLRNDSSSAQRAVPLAITVRGAGGSTLYSNTGSGLAPSLVTVSYVPAHATTTWIDDQVQAAETPTSLSAEAGEGKRTHGQVPLIEVHRGEIAQEAGGTEIKGTAVNRSKVTQKELVIYAVSAPGGRIVAAGRAVLAELTGGASAPFSILLIGAARGGSGLSLSAPATILR
jgi:hypothetical protein